MHTIHPYVDALHRARVIHLWQVAFAYDTPHNKPALVIDLKLAAQDGLLFVAQAGDTVSGTIMAGYDGHRGWLYSVAVHPDHRKQGLGTLLVRHAEQVLMARGAVKINLQIADGNEAVAAFYETLGYQVEKRVSMGKIVAANVPV
jgi:ribosomal protein S18 acetylase RimI-like enzyme